MNTVKIDNTEDYAYHENEDLEEIEIEEGVTEIGERTFSSCKNLRRVKLPSTLKTIGPSAFQGCENLEEITIPSSVKKIGYRAFANCKRLKKIIIPEGVKEIEWAAFSECENLEEVVLPNTLELLEAQLFLNCKNLKKVTLPKSATFIPEEMFRGCHSLNIELGENIKSIQKNAFHDCYRQSHFPTSATTLGKECFKNCRSLTNVTLNNAVTELDKGVFDGCSYLTNITYHGSNKIIVHENVFRNCTRLQEVPNFIANYSNQLFENCTSLTTLTPISSIIPFACFRGCKNLREINNLQRVIEIGSFAFSGCENIEEANLSNLGEINSESFSNCKRLRKVILPPQTRRIGSRAFFNCEALEDIDLPLLLEKLEKEAFRGCHSIKSITIPSGLSSFEDGALSYMDSLEEINVSPYNKTFMTPDHKILINEQQQAIVLYASGLKDRSYSMESYNQETDPKTGHSLIRPTTYIGPCAFAGAKNLEELSICGCVKTIEANAFKGCDKLKKLNVISMNFFTCPSFNVVDHGRPYNEQIVKEKNEMPFEHVEFMGDPVQIFPRALQNFRKVKTLTLPTSNQYTIATQAFTDCEELKEVTVPSQVMQISQHSFPLETTLKFENGLELQGLVALIHDTKYIGEYKLYVMADGTYHIEQDGKITTLSKKYIDDVCSQSEHIRDNPVLFLDFMNSLMEHDLGLKILFNGILMKYMSLEGRQILLESMKPEDDFFPKVLRGSHLLDDADENTQKLLKGQNFRNFVKYVEILRKNEIQNPLLYNKVIIANMPAASFETLVENDIDLLTRTIESINLLNPDQSTNDKKANESIFQSDSITDFIGLIKRYKIKDQFLFDKTFIAAARNPLMEELFKVYDANTKRLLKLSKVLDNPATSIQNLDDLLILMKITGALEEDPLIRQQASTFISEKIFAEHLPTDAEINIESLEMISIEYLTSRMLEMNLTENLLNFLEKIIMN